MIVIIWLNIVSECDSISDSAYMTNLYIKYQNMVRYAVSRKVSDEEIKKDLVQEVFCRLIPRISLLKSLPPKAVSTYIYNTSVNVCCKYYRSRQNQFETHSLEDDSLEMEADFDFINPVELDFETNDEYNRLVKVISGLSLRDRNLIIYKYVYEMKNMEIADALDIPVKQISVYIERARKKAMESLKGDEIHV